MKETRYEPMVINWDDDEWHLQGRLRKAPRDVFPYDLPPSLPRDPWAVTGGRLRALTVHLNTVLYLV